MMIERPCRDPKLVLLDSCDQAWEQFRDRLNGLATDEYLWEPVSGCWSVRASRSGTVVVDGAGEREIDPAPVTTIAWRLWHIAVDCLDDYSERVLGRRGAAATGDNWYLEAEPGLADIDRAWRNFRDGLGALTLDEWWGTLGDEWGAYAQHSVHDLALHALHEVTHHGAEIALLRDLYRARVTSLDS
jgi:hypothetical protein